jgi:Icc-related predicted phosphoesterase
LATETDTRRIALISDVHGNLPAFQAVLRAIDEEGVDAIWCLGDLVGYGAQPNECVELAGRSVDLCLIGNHDLVVIDRLDIADFSANAAQAAVWTQRELGDDARAYLEKLEPADEKEALGLYHASPTAAICLASSGR